MKKIVPDPPNSFDLPADKTITSAISERAVPIDHVSDERAMSTDDTQFTVGKTTFYQGENQTHPLFRIEPGIPCKDAREQASELMGYVRELTITGLMDEKPMMIWASHYLCAMAKALMDDAELGMKH